MKPEESKEKPVKPGHEFYKSKHFSDKEIKRRLPDGSLYLEDGVKRIKSWDDIEYKNSLLEHELEFIEDENINYYDINQMREKIKKSIEEDNDWGDEYDISKIYPIE